MHQSVKTAVGLVKTAPSLHVYKRKQERSVSLKRPNYYGRPRSYDLSVLCDQPCMVRHLINERTTEILAIVNDLERSALHARPSL